MPNYTCIRCNFETKRKSSFKKHLLRKNVCKPTRSEVSILEVIDLYKPNFDEVYEQIVIIQKNIAENSRNHSRNIAEI